MCKPVVAFATVSACLTLSLSLSWLSNFSVYLAKLVIQLDWKTSLNSFCNSETSLGRTGWQVRIVFSSPEMMLSQAVAVPMVRLPLQCPNSNMFHLDTLFYVE